MTRRPVHNRHSTIDHLRRGFLALLTSLVVLLFVSCSQYIDPNVPEPIRPFVEAQYGSEYLLYRPSSYNREHAWPLIVVCHSSFPDTPNRRIRAWTELAESHGFLLVAPQLSGTKSSWSRSGDETRKRQADDEARILSVIQHVRAGYNVSDDRILIHGLGAGAASALRTGLRHPQTFRAIGLTQPRFDASQLADVASWIDPYQPVNLNYAGSDLLTGKEGRTCADWLRAYGAELRADPTGSATGSDDARQVEFFQQVIRKEPWLHVTVAPTGPQKPLEMRFKLLSSYPPSRFRWQFGDGDESPVAEPSHAYAKAGTYRVTVTVEGQQAGRHTRIADLTVPEGVVRPAHGPTP